MANNAKSNNPSKNNPKPGNPSEQQNDRRQRAYEARMREQRSEAIRRRIVLGVSATLVVAIAGGAVWAVNDAKSKKSGSSASAAANAQVVTPANTTGDGTVITYGKADAAHTLTVYEDFRCPICQKFETTDGQAVQQLADNGTYKIDYHVAAFLDDNLGGTGSINALAAAGAALNQSVDDFKKFHDVLYANQPDEQTDGFGNVNTLISLAAKVPGLNMDAFTAAVKANTYMPWAQKVAAQFNTSGVTGTPTLKLDGKALNVFGNSGPITPDQYTAMIKQQIGG
ncbi:protein-disulfide isomerase [Kitasatospora sp. MAP12-15]|uniref:DsbA family protein n=1 Tax=unclassified Kitasatospora TaxID=2633591 RepID=UPI0024736534|nr:thioredoxin domain-containing protein [Kitasatospora sp. MAP12-44]MDH6109757.1 protein-disulfide isomerase [Kitasatospora sp. MAP12-44]